MSIKEQVGGLVEKQEWERLKQEEVAQSSLSEFIEEEYNGRGEEQPGDEEKPEQP
jgi:hypothetical protein